MAGDPFLLDPSKKRKRSSKQQLRSRPSEKNRPAPVHDEEISSDSETEEVNLDNGSGDYNVENMSSDDEFEAENAADKRRRLAKQYLENIKDTEFASGDFDAADLDDDIVATRLQQDVAEDKGYIYKFIGDQVENQINEFIKLITTRIGCKNLTNLSIKYPYLYTVSKDVELIKWNISQKPTRIKHVRGGSKYFQLNSKNVQLNHHFDQINCVAASPDGKYVVTGGSDNRLIVWSSENLSCLKVFELRCAINSICFRRNSDQLFAACSDLRVRTYSINQFAQLEILYGHQDNIADISGLARETCVSVGSRDKTVMFWKISEESRLTFRGGDQDRKKKKDEVPEVFHAEGSIDVVSMVDESHFITGSDNGNLALWSLAKKKPLFVQRLAHGLLPALESGKASAETSLSSANIQIPERQPYWITSVHAIPYSDVFFTGSYDGTVRVWRIDKEGLRSFSLIGEIANVKGVVVGIEAVEVKDEGELQVHILVSKEHRHGRWLGKVQGARNALITFTLNV